MISQQALGRGEGGVRRRLLWFALALALAFPSVSAALADIPSALPPCALKLTTGQPVSFANYRGQVLYVDFWASWCAPCQSSFPFMNELQQSYGAKGLHVLAIGMDEKPADAARFLNRHPASFDVVRGPNGQCAKDFGVAAMPTSYLIDRKGTIRAVHKGFRAGDPQELRARLEELIAEGAAGQ